MICCSLRHRGRSCSRRSEGSPNTSTTATRWASRCSTRGQPAGGVRRRGGGRSVRIPHHPERSSSRATAPDPRRDRRPPVVGGDARAGSRCRLAVGAAAMGRLAPELFEVFPFQHELVYEPASSTGACSSTSPCTRAAPTPCPCVRVPPVHLPAGSTARALAGRASSDAPARARRRSDPDRTGADVRGAALRARRARVRRRLRSAVRARPLRVEGGDRRSRSSSSTAISSRRCSPPSTPRASASSRWRRRPTRCAAVPACACCAGSERAGELLPPPGRA